MLANLRHYLERHAGVPRRVAWPRRKIGISREATFQKLLGRGGLFQAGALDQLREGQRYSLRAATGDAFSGHVEFVRPPRGFCITVENLNNALLWLGIEGSAGKHEVQLWLSAYGLPDAQVTAFKESWAGILQKLFP